MFLGIGLRVIRRRHRLQLSETQRQSMRKACEFNAQLMDYIRPSIGEGVSTQAIDQMVHEFTMDHGHIPACLGYEGEKEPFPKSCCTSVNDVICHGIPGPYNLKSGDIVNLDLTTIVDGWHGDQSETFLIGDVDLDIRKIVQCAFECLYLAIDAIYPGCSVSVIGTTIEKHVADNYGFGVVDKYVGHGIGLNFHQPPNIPHVFTHQSKRDHLSPGMCFTIEPMINGGTAQSLIDRNDGWTVRTRDGEISAQFEHTILMTETAAEVMTQTNMGPQFGHKFV